MLYPDLRDKFTLSFLLPIKNRENVCSMHTGVIEISILITCIHSSEDAKTCQFWILPFPTWIVMMLKVVSNLFEVLAQSFKYFYNIHIVTYETASASTTLGAN